MVANGVASGKVRSWNSTGPPAIAMSIGGDWGLASMPRSLALPAGGAVKSSLRTMTWSFAADPTAASVYAAPGARVARTVVNGLPPFDDPAGRISTVCVPAGTCACLVAVLNGTAVSVLVPST